MNSKNNFDYTTRDYEGFRTLMIDKLSEVMPEYTDTRQSDAGIVILEQLDDRINYFNAVGVG